MFGRPVGLGQNVQTFDHPDTWTVRHVNRMIRFDNILQSGLTVYITCLIGFAQISQAT